jgi:hypothetical protein
LVNWEQFQELFVDLWCEKHMRPRLRDEAEPLVEYTEPINSRIFRTAGALSAERQEKFKALREQYAGLACFALQHYLPVPGRGTRSRAGQ